MKARTYAGFSTSIQRSMKEKLAYQARFEGSRYYIGMTSSNLSHASAHVVDEYTRDTNS